MRIIRSLMMTIIEIVNRVFRGDGAEAVLPLI
jgi:hypothetical protein